MHGQRCIFYCTDVKETRRFAAAGGHPYVRLPSKLTLMKIPFYTVFSSDVICLACVRVLIKILSVYWGGGMTFFVCLFLHFIKMHESFFLVMGERDRCQPLHNVMLHFIL